MWNHLNVELITSEACKIDYTDWLHPEKVLQTENSTSIVLSKLRKSIKLFAGPDLDDNSHPYVPVSLKLIKNKSAFREMRIALTPSEIPTCFMAYRPKTINDSFLTGITPIRELPT